MNTEIHNRLQSDLMMLSSREFRGRGLIDGAWVPAAEFIRDSMRGVGVGPSEHYSHYWQEFAVERRTLLDGGGIVLGEVNVPLGERARIAAVGSGIVKAPLVFVGFGTTTPTYDDYEGIDATGMVAISMTGNHAQFDKTSTSNWDEYKVLNALHHGAKGLIVIEGLPLENGAKAQLASDGYTSPYFPRVLDWMQTKLQQRFDGGLLARLDSFLVAYIHVEVIGDLLRTQGVDIPAVHEQILRGGQPRSQLLELGCSLSCKVEISRDTLANVIGLVPGLSRPRTHILIGAHYDHLGEEPSTGCFYPGADDNASGVAALLEVARRVADRPLPSSLILTAFTAEEIGLLGSDYYTQHPSVPLDLIKAMVNMDSIGRGEPGCIKVSGHPELVCRARDHGLLSGLRVEEAWNGGDHDPFSDRGIPTLLLWDGGPGADQHRTTDTPDKIDIEKVAQCSDLVVRLCGEIAELSDHV